MPAGIKFAKELNQDNLGVKTPAVYDSNLDEWLMLSGNYVKTAGGLWVPQKGTDNGEALVSLSGSNAAIPVRQIQNAVSGSAQASYFNNALPASAEINLLDTTDEIWIENLLLQTSSSVGASKLELKITPYDKNGVLLSNPYRIVGTSSAVGNPKASEINYLGNDVGWLKNIKYDTSANIYVMNTTKRLYFPNGVKISSHNTDTTTTVGCRFVCEYSIIGS